MANKNVSCKVKLFKPSVNQLTAALAPALKKTAEAMHADLQQSQTMPFGESTYVTEKGVKKLKQMGGNLQNDSTFVDDTGTENGTVYLVSDTPYARRLYFHPEYHFNKSENPDAGGKWLAPYLPGGKKQNFAQQTFNKFYKEEAGI